MRRGANERIEDDCGPPLGRSRGRHWRQGAVVAGLMVAGCGAGPSLQTSVGEALGEPIDVTAIKNVCELPIGTPITAAVVFLGCVEDKVPVLLDTVCQSHSASSRSCAYAVDAFANPLVAARPHEIRLLQP